MSPAKDHLLKKLLLFYEEKGMYDSLSQFLEWDLETYMPSSGIEFRSRNLRYLQGESHKRATSRKIPSLLSALKKENLTLREKALVREMEHDYKRETKLPRSFVRTFSSTVSKAMHTWREAKEKNDFALFAPHLKKLVTLCRKKADFFGFSAHPYDALLDLFEPGMTVATVEPLFAALKTRLPHLLQKIRKDKPDAVSKLSYPKHLQKKLCLEILSKMGLHPQNSNLSESAHPFCLGLHPTDIRLTTHFNVENFLPALFAAIHEGGHGLYESNLPAAFFGTPLGQACSHGIHESQSRFWETLIGHSKPFLLYTYNNLDRFFPDFSSRVSFDALYKTVNHVEPSLIRIFSDEVTYNLHIILRFEIEKGLIEGSLRVQDVPRLWNDKMEELFGIRPDSDKNGCLQDIHWSMGAFGYFPSYTLGNLYAGTLLRDLQKTSPHFVLEVERGEFQTIASYLKEKIHVHGREYSPHELIEKATGAPFSIEPYLSYLETKYPI